MGKTSDNIHVLELSAYTSPRISENKNKNWVEYSDMDGDYPNDYFQYLIDRATYSTTNGAIIRGISMQIYGKGINCVNAYKRPEDWVRFKSILKDEDIKRLTYDYKCLGMGALQVTIEKNKIKSVTHFPMQTLRAEKMDEDGKIMNWYYHPDWINIKPSDEPKAIKDFKNTETKGNGNYMYIFSRYVAGFNYYNPVDYCGALPYATLEEHIGDFLINDVRNHFSGTKVVNFNNGLITDEKKRKATADDVKTKLTGATGQRVIVSFNNSVDNQTTVDDIPLDNAPDHYTYLAEECFKKLVVGHRVTNPMLLGVRDTGGGLGNNAEEIQTATLLMDNLTIKPYQLDIIDGIQEIIAFDGLSFDLYFRTLEPLEFIDTSNTTTEKQKQMETGLSEEVLNDFTDREGEEMLEKLVGDTVMDDWELVDEREWSEENESIEEWAKKKIKPNRNIVEKLAAIIKSYPNRESKLDASIYKVRYQYAQKYSSSNSRDFCKKMMARTDRGVMYRKEDIDMASFQGVNKEHGHKGRGYSLLRFKGGVNCGHYWKEQLYRLKSKTDGTFVPDKALSSSKEVNKIPAKNKPSITKDAPIPPKDMKMGGHHPEWIAKHMGK